jgi:hypothetical protein
MFKADEGVSFPVPRGTIEFWEPKKSFFKVDME